MWLGCAYSSQLQGPLSFINMAVSATFPSFPLSTTTNEIIKLHSRHNSVGVATSYGLDGWSLIPGRSKKYFLLQSSPTGSRTHKDCHPAGYDGSLIRGKAAVM
jgi:hypothetical protein